MPFLPPERHCDRYLADPEAPECLKRFIRFYRHPAMFRLGKDYLSIWATLLRPKYSSRTAEGDLYIDLWIQSGSRVRLTMVSRFGDVGITPLDTGGYITRCALDELTNFGETK